MNVLGKYGFLWITLILFSGSIIAHWTFAWYSYLDEQREHNQQVQVNGYLNSVIRDTMENWQSEFLQLMWQVGGLSILLWYGSSQSKHESDRLEKKIDHIMEEMNLIEIRAQLDKEYMRK